MSTQAQQMARMASGIIYRTLPKTPKLPQQLRDRMPDLKEAFDAYDKEWETYFKENEQNGR